MRKLAAAALLLLVAQLGGCAHLALGLGAAAGIAQAPTWLTAAQDAVAGVRTLSAAAQLACELQAEANRRDDGAASAGIGRFCTW